MNDYAPDEVPSTPAAQGAGEDLWPARYAERPATPADREAGRVAADDVLALDTAGPRPGIDGATYWAGRLTTFSHPDVVTAPDAAHRAAGFARGGHYTARPVALVIGDGGRQVVRGFASLAAVREWIADRVAASPRPLAPAATPGTVRTEQEEAILGYLLEFPRYLDELGGWLPPTTFTTHARYDIYLALLDVHRSGEPVDVGAVADALAARLDGAPEWVRRPGADGEPGALAYLRRLALSAVRPDDAITACHALIETDLAASLAARAARGRRHLPPQAGTGRDGGVPDWTAPSAPSGTDGEAGDGTGDPGGEEDPADGDAAAG